MEKDRVIPLFIAVCLFYVSGKLLSLLIRSGPWPYVIAAVASLVLGYVLYDDSVKDRGLSLLVSAVVFVIIGKLLLWMFEVIPQLIWGNDLPGFFYNWVASFMTLIFGGLALLVICFMIGDRLYFRRLKPWLEN